MPRRDFKWNAFEKLRVKSSTFSNRTKKSGLLNATHARKFIITRWESVQEIRQRIAFWLIGMGLLIAAVALQFVWFSGNYIKSASVRGGTYIEGIVGDVATLNPLYTTTAPEQAVSQLVFSSLYKYDEKGGLKEDFASGVQTANGGKTYIVHLRNDASWQDGQPMTANDVIYTVKMMQNPKARSALYTSWKNISITKIDEHTVKFDLGTVYAPFEHALTFPIMPEHVLSKIEPSRLRETIDGTTLVGSGPYKIVSMQDVAGVRPHKVVRLVRSANYYAGAPSIERIQLYSYRTQSQLIDAVKNGDVDAASGLNISNAADIHSNKYTVKVRPMASGVYALFNTTRGPLTNQNVRSALQMGTDIDALLKKYSLPMYKLAGPFTRYQVNVAGIEPPAYSKERASQLLTKAGWKYGNDAKRYKGKESLTLNIVTVKDSDYEKAANELARQWKELGVEVHVTSIDTSDPAQNIASSVLQPREYDVLVYELFLGSDPDVYAYWHSSQADNHGLNLANYKDPVSDDILVSARARSEPNLREAKYQSFAKRWIEHAPAIGLYESEFVYVSKPRIHSIRDDSYFVTPSSHFTDINYWTVKNADVYKTP